MTQKKGGKQSKALLKKQEKLRKLEAMIALEKKKLAEKMDNDDDSDDTDSHDSDRGDMEVQDDNTININAMLYKDQNSEFSNMTTGSLKVDKTPQMIPEQIQQAQNL